MNIIINVESRTDNPRETDNIGYTRHKTKHKQNTQDIRQNTNKTHYVLDTTTHK